MKNKNSGIGHDDKRELLTAIFTLCLLDEFVSDAVLDELVADSRKAALKRVASLRPSKKGSIEFDVLGHVIYQWQRSPKYLAEDGNPKRIPARGRAPSIESLFREISRKDYFELGLRHLRQLGRIQRLRASLYLPRHEVTIVQTLRPELVELLVRTINRVVATVLHNTSLTKKDAIRLIERVTAVPDLPDSEIESFKLFAREQGGALINTMNDWLERRRGETKARRTNRSHLTAGLHVFAFVEGNSK